MNKRHRHPDFSKFEISRAVRTQQSERYFIHHPIMDETIPLCVGHFDLHMDGDTYYGSLVLLKKFRETELETLLTQIDRLIPKDEEVRVDFILSVYQAKEIGLYSDSMAGKYKAYADSTDIEDISSSLNKVLGRHQNARGLLVEHALVEYFKRLGYKSERAGSDLDHKKIDVIATNSKETVFAQAKLGSVSQEQMRSLAVSVAELEVEKAKSNIAAVTASVFPADSEFIRLKIERETGVPLICIQQYQLLDIARGYRRSLR